MVVSGGQGTSPVSVSINFKLSGTYGLKYSIIAGPGQGGNIQAYYYLALNSFYQQGTGTTFLLDGSFDKGINHSVNPDGTTIDEPTITRTEFSPPKTFKMAVSPA
jgi:hypothetical protein